MTNKPTDAEIIKALECCTSDKCTCKECAYEDTKHITNEEYEIMPNGKHYDDYSCDEWLKIDLLNLINRLKAENEDLEIKLKHFAEFLAEAEKKNEELKAENERLSHEIYVLKLENSFLLKSKGNLKMNKEFKHEIKQAKAEAIKEFADKVIDLVYEADDIFDLDEWKIRGLVKEMVGEENG